MLTEKDLEMLSSVDGSLQLIVVEAESIIPLKVVEGHRDQAAQEAAFAAGWTKLHWPNGKHNSLPSRAVDIAPLYYDHGVGKIDWTDMIAFGRIMGVVHAVASSHGVKLRFGCDWNGDFHSVGKDASESFLDAPHVELAT